MPSQSDSDQASAGRENAHGRSKILSGARRGYAAGAAALVLVSGLIGVFGRPSFIPWFGPSEGAAVEAVALSVLNNPSNPPPSDAEVDVTLRNTGSQVSVVNRAEFRIEDVRAFDSTCFESEGALENTATYSAALPDPPTRGSSVSVGVSQEVRANSADRFAFLVRTVPQQEPTWRLYRVGISLYHDGEQAPITAGSTWVALPFPDPTLFALPEGLPAAYLQQYDSPAKQTCRARNLALLRTAIADSATHSEALAWLANHSSDAFTAVYWMGALDHSAAGVKTSSVYPPSPNGYYECQASVSAVVDGLQWFDFPERTPQFLGGADFEARLSMLQEAARNVRPQSLPQVCRRAIYDPAVAALEGFADLHVAARECSQGIGGCRSSARQELARRFNDLLARSERADRALKRLSEAPSQ